MACSIVCAVVGWTTNSPAQETNVPYHAYATGSASVSSGPGFQYYATDRLAEGTKVEVHRQEKEWVGIRPPRGSFSWVPATALKGTDNPDVMQVTTAGIRPRIGTRYSTKRDVESVAMRDGELLEVIGEAKFTNGKGGLATWYKVAPPPGEFRWMLATSLANAPLETAVADENEKSNVVAASYEVAEDVSDTDRTELESANANATAETNDSVAKNTAAAGGITTLVPIDSSQMGASRIPAYVINESPKPKVNKAALESGGKQDGGVQQAQWSYDLGPRSSLGTFGTNSPPRRQAAPNGAPIMQQRPLPGSPFREVNSFRGVRQVASNAPLPARNAAARNPAAKAAATSTANQRTPGAAATPVANTPVPPCGPARSQLWLMQQELTDIDLRLAQTVTQAPTSWSLSMLRARTQAVIDSSQVATVRDEGQRILAKIAQFEDVQRRTRRVGSSNMAVAATMPNGGVSPTAAAAGSWLANVPPEYFESGSTLAGSYGDPYSDLESYASVPSTYGGSVGGALGGTYGGTYGDGYVPMPGETVIADRRADEPAPSNLALGSPSGSRSNSRYEESSVATSEGYDGRGWLMPVVTDRDNMPRYVLTDSKGNVKQFVTPQPGLNLKRYLRKEIAIYGQKRFIDNLQRPHLTAERIVTMDSTVRR